MDDYVSQSLSHKWPYERTKDLAIRPTTFQEAFSSTWTAVLSIFTQAHGGTLVSCSEMTLFAGLRWSWKNVISLLWHLLLGITWPVWIWENCNGQSKEHYAFTSILKGTWMAMIQSSNLIKSNVALSQVIVLFKRWINVGCNWQNSRHVKWFCLTNWQNFENCGSISVLEGTHPVNIFVYCLAKDTSIFPVITCNCHSLLKNDFLLKHLPHKPLHNFTKAAKALPQTVFSPQLSPRST